MYWIYLIIFILAVLTPEIITKDVGPIGQERVEELIIFGLGVISFLVLLIRERQLSKSRNEKTEIQKEKYIIVKYNVMYNEHYSGTFIFIIQKMKKNKKEIRNGFLLTFRCLYTFLIASSLIKN